MSMRSGEPHAHPERWAWHPAPAVARRNCARNEAVRQARFRRFVRNRGPVASRRLLRARLSNTRVAGISSRLRKQQEAARSSRLSESGYRLQLERFSRSLLPFRGRDKRVVPATRSGRLTNGFVKTPRALSTCAFTTRGGCGLPNIFRGACV